MTGFARELGFLIDLHRARRGGPAALARRRDARLAALVRHARTASPFYRALYRGLPAGDLPLADLPPVDKPQLMAHFDDWVTDPGVTRADLEAFVADPALIGVRYRGRYLAFTSSGTTGHPGLFLHDPDAVACYRALAGRIAGDAMDARRLLALLQRGSGPPSWWAAEAISPGPCGWNPNAAATGSGDAPCACSPCSSPWPSWWRP
ncbi:hypothetical protein ACTWLI_01045 [Arthrobacter sp. Hor0625]|uniref:hypothetical protein n=1 Tax=Arthrobacter sp. Hor0625 TaxID=3457358 RepID=UPI00403E601E